MSKGASGEAGKMGRAGEGFGAERDQKPLSVGAARVGVECKKETEAPPPALHDKDWRRARPPFRTLRSSSPDQGSFAFRFAFRTFSIRWRISLRWARDVSSILVSFRSISLSIFRPISSR